MSKNRPDFASSTSGNRPAASGATPVAAEPSKSKAKAKRGAESPWPWGRFRRLAVSALVLLHLTAVVAAPWCIQLRDIRIPALPPGMPVRDAHGRIVPLEELDPERYPPQPPTLPLALYEFFFHYANLVYINNGYNFFSPDPDASRLIRFWVYNSAGDEIATDTFPDLKSQWPRLFYHRHMMLAAQVREFGEDGLRLVARRLLRTIPGAARVHVELGMHELLTPEQVKANKPLNASDTYQTIAAIDEYAPQDSGGETINVGRAAR